MIVSIAQPAYLAWLGYFHRIAISDLHVSLNDVAIGHRSFANRNKVRTQPGWTWLTVPLAATGSRGSDLISEVRIADDPRWRHKHWRTISQSYARAPHFDEHRDHWESVYAREWRLMEDLTRETTGRLLDDLGIGTEIVRSSQLGVEGRKSELILNLCREVGATVYVSGPFGRDYLDLESFSTAGIRVAYHEYSHPEYEQAWPGFEPAMAAIDALFNLGPATRDAMMQGNVGKKDIEREV